MRWEKKMYLPLCPVVVETKPVSPPKTMSCNVGIMSQPPIMDCGSSSSAAAASPLLPTVPSGDGMPQQQQQQPTPRAHDINHGGSAKMNQLLDANYLGVHALAVGQVKATEFTRQINAGGLNKVKLSIKTKRWVNSNTPYVLLPREQLPSGKDTVFSADLLQTLTVYCLDGNHRIQALLELEGAGFSVECRLYLHFDCAETINALARSEYSHHRFFVSSCHVLRPCVVVKIGYLQHHYLFCFHARGTSILLCRHEQSKISARCLYVQLAGVNGVTGATAETTTYDRIFSTMKAMEAIMAGKGITDPIKVTAVMLANAYKKVWNEIVQPFLASLIFCTRCLG